MSEIDIVAIEDNIAFIIGRVANVECAYRVVGTNVIVVLYRIGNETAFSALDAESLENGNVRLMEVEELYERD